MSAMKEVPTEELLNFQDYPTTHTTSSANNSTIDIDNTTPTNPQKTPHSESTDINAPDAPIPQQQSFWTINYYQTFFDVSTQDVIDRITLKSDNIKHRPDLYGPFWISVTLVFTIAISGNIANYLQRGVSTYRWQYDFNLVSYAATAIFAYITIIPMAVWAAIRAASTETAEGAPKPLELVCMYGYSMFVYIPAAVLWTIQYAALQWIVVGVAACVSGATLLRGLTPALMLCARRLLLTAGIATLHLLLAAGFMLYFFHVPTIINNQTQFLIPQVNKTM